jgi:hypothetical protein
MEHTVSFPGFPVPVGFELGGRSGNVVVSSATSKVLKGWRVASVNGANLLEGAVKSAIADAHRTPAGFTVRFVDPLLRRKSSIRAANSPLEKSASNPDPRFIPSAPAPAPAPDLGQAPAPAPAVGPAPILAPEPALGRLPEAAPAAGSSVTRGNGALSRLPAKLELAEPQHALLASLCQLQVSADEVARVKRRGPCDKCDGPHHEDECPHYPQAREAHADAWLHKGSGAVAEPAAGARDGVELLHAVRVVRQPGDGSCLFHSLAHFLGGSASSLRAETAAFAAANADFELGGSPLRDWILWDSGLSPEEYAKRMGTGSHWGGAIEIAICSLARRARIAVYEKRNSGWQRISDFDLCSGSAGSTRGPLRGKPIRLLYSGRVHYDAME